MYVQLKKKAGSALDLLQDERFSKLFENPDFQVDINSEDYRLLNPLVSKLEKTASNKQKRQTAVQQQFTEIQVNLVGRKSLHSQNLYINYLLLGQHNLVVLHTCI